MYEMMLYILKLRVFFISRMSQVKKDDENKDETIKRITRLETSLKKKETELMLLHGRIKGYETLSKNNHIFHILGNKVDCVDRAATALNPLNSSQRSL